MTVSTENVHQTSEEFTIGLKPKEDNKYQMIPYDMKIKWPNVVIISSLHAMSVWGLMRFGSAKLPTILWAWLLSQLSMYGVTLGAHRLWSHQSYKANLGVRFFLMCCQTLGLENHIFQWARDHRVHHKWQETDADPHNSERGFFFAHVGWLLVTKHPEVAKKGATVDLSDLLADPIVTFQRKFYFPLVLLIWGAIPTLVPYYCWGESLSNAFLIAVLFRYVLILNFTWMINSWAHMVGNRPYDQKLAAVDISIFRDMFLGDGHHNYHHAFPWDYSQSEFGAWDMFNPTTVIINFWHYMGWAWDLKKVKAESVQNRMKSSGDPSLAYSKGNFILKYAKGLVGYFGTLALMLSAHFALKAANVVV